mmetsp:Transcript_48418/g.156162  ORF Transcript_48418/g.156162 Transcript_48418/m.156162 type:complete len:381 (-) Transcript_48418:84-1226(-)
MAMREAAGGASVGGGAGAHTAVRRIQRELKEISESPSRHWTAYPQGDDLFEWQFAIRGPPATEFEGGIYTGRLVLPVNYPMAPPSITMTTPNGRWEINKKICLSNTSYHPDLWQPAWGIRTMMEALRSHFPVPGDGAVGAIDWPVELRKKLAKESLDFVCGPGTRRNRELLPELSPDELQEDQPEPVPPDLRAPAIVEPAAAAAAAPAADAPGPVEAASAAAAPSSWAEAAALATSATDAHAETSPEGVRQRHGSVASTVGPSISERVSSVPSGAPSGGTAAPTPSLAREVSTAPSGASGPSSSSAQPRRSRQEGPQQRRPQASVVVQLLKPPESGRGWVLLLINALIVLLSLSFLVTLVDLFRNPPQLLDQLPDTRQEE